MYTLKNLYHNLKYYFSSLFIIWVVLWFYRTNDYYLNFLIGDTQSLLLRIAYLYTVLGFGLYVVLSYKRLRPNRSFIIIRGLYRYVPKVISFLRSFPYDLDTPKPRLHKEERLSIMFYLVKIFFLPIMFNFMFQNYNAMVGYFDAVPTQLTMNTFNNFFFPMLIPIMFFIDTLYFSFGYTFEAGFLRNKVRSVEPTIVGWMVALLCYPPYNDIVSYYVQWFPDNNVWFSSDQVTMIMRIIIVILFGIYLWATLALGTKCSNLTNRGIVSGGPYRFVRHPAYISKNLVWWITIKPVMSFAAFAGMFIWSILYFLRAITEERHLLQDPDYQVYVKKVKYRFIPFVY